MSASYVLGCSSEQNSAGAPDFTELASGDGDNEEGKFLSQMVQEVKRKLRQERGWEGSHLKEVRG